MKKVLLIAICVVIFFTTEIMSTNDLTLKEQIGTLVGYLMGLHFVYGYLFNTEIYMTGYTVPVGEKPKLRLGLLIAGIGVMIGTLFYLLGP